MAITISGENNNDKILASDGVIDQISGINIVGVITATTFTGNLIGNVTGNLTGNVNSTSPLLLQTGGSERFRITGNNELGIAGANYGSAGQVLTSGGSGSAVTWSAIPAQITFSNPSNNRILTSEGGIGVNAESTLTYDGTKFGIGTNNPDGKTHIYESSAGSVTAATDANDLVIESSANVGMSLLTANNSIARIKFGDPDATNAGALVYNHQNDKLSIITATGNRMIIGADMISSRTHYGVARTAGGYTFRETNEGGERAGMHSNASNDLIFKTGSASQKLTIDSSGRVMIGNTSASTQFGDSNDLVIGNTSGAHGITIITSDSTVGRLLFSDSTSSGAATYQGQINYNHSNNRLDLRTYTAGTITLSTSNTERFFIQSNGRVVIGNSTGTQPSATVGGAQFYGGSYPGDFRISSGAGASGTETASMAIMGSNHHASIENGSNSGAQLNLYNYNTNTGNSTAVSFMNKNGLSSARILGLNIDHDNRDGALVFMVADGSHPTEAARIIQNKNIGIQASTNVNNRVEIGGGTHYVVTNSGQARGGIHIRGQAGNSGEFGGGISFSCNPNGGNTGAAAIAGEQMSADTDVVGLAFFTHPTSTGSDDAVKRMKIMSDGGIILNNWSASRGYIFQRLGSGSYPDFPNVQGSQGRGMIDGQRAVSANTSTEIARSHWGGLALVGYSNSKHQGVAYVMFGYGSAGASVRFSGHWVRQESLTISFSVSAYSLNVSHNASDDLNVWCVLVGV